MIIGHQENTLDKGRIDLLAFASDASLILIEFKRDRTPREVVAQVLDYASWVDDLTADRLSQKYEKFSRGGNLGDAFKHRFNTEMEEESLTRSEQESVNEVGFFGNQTPSVSRRLRLACPSIMLRMSDCWIQLALQMKVIKHP